MSPKLVCLLLSLAALPGAAVILLSGCDPPEGSDGKRFFDKHYDVYSFDCDKQSKEFTVTNEAGDVVNSGPLKDNTTCPSILTILKDNPKAVISVANTPDHASAVGPARLSSVVYLVDVANYKAVQIFDPVSFTFTEVDLPFTQPLSTSGNPAGEALTPDGKFLWVVQEAIGTLQPPRITIMDTAARAFTSTFNLPAGIDPNVIFLSPDGATAYIANRGITGGIADNSVLVVDTASRSVVTTIPTPLGAGPSQMTPDGLLFYTIANSGSAITVVDTTTNTVAATIKNLSGLLRLFLNPTGTRLYAVTYTGVLVYDTATNLPVTTVPTLGFLSFNDTWIDFSPLGETFVIFDGAANITYTVDARTNKILSTVKRPPLQHGFMFILPN